MDLVVVLDSSSTMTSSWHNQMAFVSHLLRTLEIGENKTRVGLFRYNRDVDTASEIMLGDVQTIDVLEGRLFQMSQSYGVGTRTGNALEHALKVSFSKENGNRENIPDVMLLVTDGRSQDSVDEISQQIKNTDIHMNALGIKVKRGGPRTLRKIAGKNVYLFATWAQVSIHQLSRHLSKKLHDDLCTVSCDERVLPEGMVASCSNELNIGSTCTYSCTNAPERIYGPNTALCTEDGFWSRPLPQCEVRCSVRRLPAGMLASCSDGVNAGSTCTYSCTNSPAAIYGDDTATCGEDGLWSQPIPLCEVRCSERDVPEGMSVECSDGINEDSVCTYTCNDITEKVYGDNTARCTSRGTWSRPIPVCETKPICEPPVLKDMVVQVCSNDFYEGSVCSYTCSHETMGIEGPAQSECISDDRSGLAAFSAQPCCTPDKCSVNFLMDLVIVVDSSSSITHEYWPAQMEFIKKLVTKDLIIGPDNVRVGMFRYLGYVDEETEFYLSNTTTQENLMAQIAVIEGSYDGSPGTFTGHALNHTNYVQLTEAKGNRIGVPDVVVVITDGVTSRFSPVEVATQLLRSRDELTVFAIGIGLNERGLKTLNTIAGGDERYMYNVEGGFSILDDAVEQISGTLEKRACSTCATDEYFAQLQAAQKALGMGEGGGSGAGKEDEAFMKFIEDMFHSNQTETTASATLN